MLPKPLVLCLSVLVAAAPASAARRPGEPLETRLQPVLQATGRATRRSQRQAGSATVSRWCRTVPAGIRPPHRRAPGGSAGSKQSGFQFTFTVLNVPEINAFALPGGPMFIYTGLLNACDNEAQLAGVMGHEMSHVILRHGTHEATKANLIQLPAMLAGAVIGNEGTMARLANMGLGLGANSFILKFSRDAETEADALGSRPDGRRRLRSHPDGSLLRKAGARSAAAADSLRPSESRATANAPSSPRCNRCLPAIYVPDRRIRAHEVRAEIGSAAAEEGGRRSTAAGCRIAFRNLAELSKARAWRSLTPGNWQVFGDRDSSSVTIAPREGCSLTGRQHSDRLSARS